MQADGSTLASSKHARGPLPFHLSSLDFHVSPDKLQLLTSEQLGSCNHTLQTDATR